MHVLKQISAGTVEPLALEDIKLWLRIDANAEDSLLQALITGARQHAENFLDRSLVTTQWQYTLDSFPLAYLRDGLFYSTQVWDALWRIENPQLLSLPREMGLELPESPLVSIQSLTYVDATGATQTLAPETYEVLAGVDGNPVLFPIYGALWPVTQAQAAAVQIQFTAGYPAQMVPEPIRMAIRQIVAHWYANREAVVVANGTTPIPLPIAAEALLTPYKTWSF